MLTEDQIIYVERLVECGDTTSIIIFIERVFLDGYDRALKDMKSARPLLSQKQLEKEFTFKEEIPDPAISGWMLG